MENRVRELALFNLGIDSKLRGCDFVSLKVRDICHGDHVASRLRDCSGSLPAGRIFDGAAGQRAWPWSGTSLQAC